MAHVSAKADPTVLFKYWKKIVVSVLFVGAVFGITLWAKAKFTSKARSPVAAAPKPKLPEVYEFSASPRKGEGSLTVTFKAVLEHESALEYWPIKAQFDFGDGNSEIIPVKLPALIGVSKIRFGSAGYASAEVKHTYRRPGTYRASVTGLTNKGLLGKEFEFIQIEVAEVFPPGGQVLELKLTPDVPVTVHEICLPKAGEWTGLIVVPERVSMRRVLTPDGDYEILYPGKDPVLVKKGQKLTLGTRDRWFHVRSLDSSEAKLTVYLTKM